MSCNRQDDDKVAKTASGGNSDLYVARSTATSDVRYLNTASSVFSIRSGVCLVFFFGNTFSSHGLWHDDWISWERFQSKHRKTERHISRGALSNSLRAKHRHFGTMHWAWMYRGRVQNPCQSEMIRVTARCRRGAEWRVETWVTDCSQMIPIFNAFILLPGLLWRSFGWFYNPKKTLYRRPENSVLSTLFTTSRLIHRDRTVAAFSTKHYTSFAAGISDRLIQKATNVLNNMKTRPPSLKDVSSMRQCYDRSQLSGQQK